MSHEPARRQGCAESGLRHSCVETPRLILPIPVLSSQVNIASCCTDATLLLPNRLDQETAGKKKVESEIAASSRASTLLRTTGMCMMSRLQWYACHDQLCDWHDGPRQSCTGLLQRTNSNARPKKVSV